MADEQEPITDRPLGMDSRAAVHAADVRHHAPVSRNVYIKASAAITQAIASGTVTAPDVKAAIAILEDAQAQGVPAEDALERVESEAPSVLDAIREQAGKPITWAFLGFLLQLLRTLYDVL